MTSPLTIARGLAIVGGWVVDNVEVNEPSGVIRAFDATTGKFVWAWDMGRPGVNTEPAEGEWYTRGTPNMWSMTSYDDKLGLMYLRLAMRRPIISAAHRARYEKYSSSVVALDVTNGSVRWSFQTVHHDIWDYDVPSQPALVDLPQADGTVIPAVARRRNAARSSCSIVATVSRSQKSRRDRYRKVQSRMTTPPTRSLSLWACRIFVRIERSENVGHHAIRSDVVSHSIQEASLRRPLYAADDQGTL